MGMSKGTCPTPRVPHASACSLRPAPSPSPTQMCCASSCPHKLAACRSLSPCLVTAAGWHSLCCHTSGTALLSPQPRRSARSLPGHEPPAQPSAWGRNPTRPIPALLPNPRVNPSFLGVFFVVFFFFLSVLSATLDEQSPPLRLPSLTHVVIRSCRYPAVICLVSALTQTRLANRCGLQLRAAASHFPTLADGGAAGRHTLVLSLPQCPAGCPARCLQGFPACKGGEVAGAN